MRQTLDEFLGQNGVDADHKMTFMERAALRTECRKLARFIRVVDFQVRQTLIALAYESAKQLWKVVHPRKILLIRCIQHEALE